MHLPTNMGSQNGFDNHSHMWHLLHMAPAIRVPSPECSQGGGSGKGPKKANSVGCSYLADSADGKKTRRKGENKKQQTHLSKDFLKGKDPEGCGFHSMWFYTERGLGVDSQFYCNHREPPDFWMLFRKEVDPAAAPKSWECCWELGGWFV